MTTALTYEERTLPPSPDGEYASRRGQMLRRQPDQAPVPPPIASASFALSGDLLAEADDATAELVRFDSERSAFVARFSTILLRTESASSSQIENLTAGPRAIAEAVIGERTDGNAQLIVSNVRAMEAAPSLAEDISSASIIPMHEAPLSHSAPPPTGGDRRRQGV